MDKVLNFNVDTYFNPYIPPNFTSQLPQPIARWFGHRKGEHKEPALLIVHAWATLGSFLGLLLIGAVFKYAPGINQFHPPVIIASMGASAVLEYAAIQTPLAQPRNAIFGHGLSAIIGVAISKAFQTNNDFSNLQWIAASIACAAAVLVMSLTNTIHPPGGASAVLACIEPQVIAMGWWFVPVILVAISLMLGVSLLNNNVMRKYPSYWWTPEEVGQRLRRRQPPPDEETASEKGSETTLARESSHDDEDIVHISSHDFRLPAHMHLREEEIAILRELQLRLQK